jgi:hypothetical protein
MNLFDLIRKPKLMEGGNLAIGGDEAQQIDLKVHNRSYIVPILDNLLQSINNAYTQAYGGPLWNPKVLKSRKYLSGSSLHFFNTDIPDDEFVRVKPKVGDIDTQVNKDAEGNLEQWLNFVKGKVTGPARLIGFQRGNEQFSSLWELTDPPIKVQIDLEFVAYEKDQPSDWSAFSHSSSWEDLSQGIKGVFHKYLIQSFTRLTTKEFLLRKLVGRGKARAEQDIPTTDNMFSFAVSSSEGGGLRPKYEPVVDEKGKPLIIDNLPVMKALPASGYEQDIGAIFQSIFGNRVNGAQIKKLLPKTWSFVGLLDIMNATMSPEDKDLVLNGFVDKLFGQGAQGLYKNDPNRDMGEKNVALNKMIEILGVAPPNNLEQTRQAYKANYKMTSEGPIGLDRPLDEEEKPAVQAQLRKNMPHLRDLKPADFLDLIDELRTEGGRFKLENIPLNVKIDGFGGRFGKNAEGKPFMGTSRTEPRYSAGFVDYHKQKGTDDPEILARAEKFDSLFNEMMSAIQMIDNKLGPDFLIDRQVTCEVLFLPFATQTDEGKLKFVGIEYDNLPKGVELVLVPYRIVEASTGKDVPGGDRIAQEIAELGQSGNVMFMSNRLTQKEGLDVTEIINPLENIEELKKIVSDTMGKRDRASLELRREVEAKLKPVQLALEKAIDEDPNIVGKNNLGQDYEGIVINSRLGPIKVTSQKQKDIIAQKQAAKKAAWAEQPRENSAKTAVVAIGSFVGHRGHEELFNYTINKAKEVNGDPYLFIGNAVGKDDPIPPDVKAQTWHKMYPNYAKNISTVQAGGSIMQKIKHELINPLPGKPPRYDNIIIMVGEDQSSMPIANALMKAVNKFQGYEHVKVTLEPTPRGTGMSFTKLRNVLKDPNATPEQQYALWSQGFDEQKLGKDWILHLMDISRKGMGIKEPTPAAPVQPAVQPIPVAEVRLFNSLVRPSLIETKRMSAAVKLQRAFDRERAKSDASRKRGEEVMAQARADAEKKNNFNYKPDDWSQDFEKRVKEEAGVGVIASKKQAKDPRYSMSLTRDVRPGQIKKNLDAFSLEDTSQAMAQTAKRLTDPKDGATAKLRAAGDKRREEQLKGRDIAKRDDMQKETMLPKSAFAGSDKNKLGPAAHLKGSMKRPARQGDLVGGMEEDWQKVNKSDKTDGMSSKAVKAYRRENPGSKLKTAVTKKPSELKKGSKDANRRKSFCARMSGMKKHNAGADTKRDPDSPINKALRRWNCESIEELQAILEGLKKQAKKKGADGKACWDGYRYNGTENGKDKCVKVSESIESTMSSLIDKIITNEAIQNNKG